MYLSSDCEDVALRMRDEFLGYVDETVADVPASGEVVDIPNIHEDEVDRSREVAKPRSHRNTFVLLSVGEVRELVEGISIQTESPSILSRITANSLIVGPCTDSKESSTSEWLPFNPLGEPSERELVCEVDWRRVWRCVFCRTDC